MAASFFKCARVPRMLRNAPRKRRGALLIRGPTFHQQTKWVPASREAALRTASRPGHQKIAAALESDGSLRR